MAWLLACAAMWGIRQHFHSHHPWKRALVAVPMVAAAIAAEVRTPRVWIFNGTPGDEAHHEHYESLIARLRTSFTTRYGVPASDITVLYGPENAGYDGLCTKEALMEELGNAAAATRDPDRRPVWIVFQGHANAIPGGALFNLPGPDISPREIGEALSEADPETPMVVIATTTCSAAFIRPLAMPGRIVISATSPDDRENETDFPVALADALESADTDANRDGLVSATELFRACHARIVAMYNMGGYMIREHAQMDGNGDGQATRRPAEIDARPASLTGLPVIGKGGGAVFD